MKTQGYVHHFITCFVLMSAAAIALKGFFLPEHTSLLLLDTGLVPYMYSDMLAFALPLALAICALLAFLELTSVAPIIICQGLYASLSGVALYQGLHFDCGCYLPGSVESQVYSQLEPQFLVMLLVIAVTSGLHYFNTRWLNRSRAYFA